MTLELFTQSQLRMLSFETALSREHCASKLELLRRLTRRIRDGSLSSLSETRVEQSFNERLFAEVFEYRTLLRDGVHDYHLLPKGAAVVGRTTNYDDFSLGFFGPGTHRRLVHAELKDYGVKLDKKQTSGRNRGLSPVEQAFGAASRESGIEWIIVSNFDEVRLYDRRDLQRYSSVVLSDLTSDDDVRRACVLLGRATLLGEPGRVSPNLKLLRGGHPMQLQEQPHYVRLIHEARPLDAAEEASLPAMDDAFRSALTETETWGWPTKNASDPSYDDGRLLIEDDSVATSLIRLEHARNGVVRLQQYLHTHNPSGQSSDVFVDAEKIADVMSKFVVLSARMIGPVFPGDIVYRWSILDGKRLVVLPGNRNLVPGLASTVDEMTSRHYTIDAWPPESSKRQHIAGYLTSAIRDLLFPWVVVPQRGKVTRLTWDNARFERMLEKIGV